jgi:hypothetical protein
VGESRGLLGKFPPAAPPPRLFADEIFTRLEDGEWAAFKRRWRTLSGSELDLP